MSRRVVPIDEAIARLRPETGDVHTFVNPAMNMLLGADHNRDTLIAKMRDGVVEEAGGEACNMGHCLVLLDYLGPGKHLFIESAPRQEDEVTR